jgi:hypothetical protein
LKPLQRKNAGITAKLYKFVFFGSDKQENTLSDPQFLTGAKRRK